MSMKGKTTCQFKKILIQNSRIDIAGGWHVGNRADNPACRYPKPVRLSTREEARNAPTPVTTYALFYDGEYVTNEQMNEKKFLKLVKD
jgi:hypothetical protein